ncbi:signal recognition particle protein Srp54 [archaeon]|nr:signal recognition particle protein Srp54 [archaeon]
MVMEKLSSNLKNVLKKIAGAPIINETLVNELVKDIQRALLHSDTNVQLVFNLTKNIKERALKEESPKGVNPREYLVNIVYEELTKFLGGKHEEIKITKAKPFKIMLAGLFGSGKTTTAGKLAKYYSKRGYKVALLGLDVHRPASMKQLQQLAEKTNVKAFIDEKEKDPIKIYKNFKPELKKFDILLIDTAGRDALSEELVKEIKNLNKEIKPDEKLLVISADLGQTAETQAKKFHESCNITGVIATKMDGTAKAGGALSATAVTDAKIKFIGTGEQIDDLEQFDPEGFVGRLLGMGDLKALLEKTKEAISEDRAEDLGKKFLKGDFNFLDMYEQLTAMKKMGPLSKVMEMIPGMGNLKLPKDALQVQDGKLKKWKVIFKSMTKKELESPEVLTRSRIDRIAKGSGTTTGEVRELLKHYRQTKKMSKMMKGDPEKLMKKFKGKLPGM